MQLGSEWHKNDGATSEAIERLQALTFVTLPSEYLDLLQYSNGGEGPLPVDPLYFILDSAEVAADEAEAATFAEFFPGLFVFGSNGGGEGFALDMRNDAPFPVVYFDMTNADLVEGIQIVASDFADFLRLIGREG